MEGKEGRRKAVTCLGSEEGKGGRKGRSGREVLWREGGCNVRVCVCVFVCCGKVFLGIKVRRECIVCGVER